MLRSRYIKPGICTNENLCELGPYAYILFTGLWMMADCQGRLEDRPKKIKAMVMPLWDEICAKDVENLVEKLCESGFIHRYTIGDQRYIQIKTWQKHQRPHQREAASIIPPAADLTAAESVSSFKASTRIIQGSSKDHPRCPRTITSTPPIGGVNAGVRDASVEKPSPPLKTGHKTQRKPPAETRSSSGPDGPQERPPKARAAPVDFAPYPAAEVEYLRASLDALAGKVHMPPPDDELLRRVFDSGYGATARQLHRTLAELYHRHKFREMRSWGLLPVILSDLFKGGSAQNIN